MTLPAKPLTLLVAEDDDSQRHYMVRMFQRRGLVVHEARDANEAVALFHAHPDITAIVSDFSMGGGDRDGDSLHARVAHALRTRGGTFIMASNTVDPEELGGRLGDDHARVINKVGHVKKALGILGLNDEPTSD